LRQHSDIHGELAVIRPLPLDGAARPWLVRALPTRRSSDLDVNGDTMLGHAVITGTTATGNSGNGLDVSVSGSQLPVQQIDVTEKDRKSTRLNSSHVKISYAVFCLRKKKKGRRLGNPETGSR